MIRIEINPDSPIVTIQTKRGAMRKQEIYVQTLGRDGKPQKYPVRAEVILGDNEQPHAPGIYTLAPASVYVDRFGSLALSPKLVSVK